MVHAPLSIYLCVRLVPLGCACPEGVSDGGDASASQAILRCRALSLSPRQRAVNMSAGQARLVQDIGQHSVALRGEERLRMELQSLLSRFPVAYRHRLSVDPPLPRQTPPPSPLPPARHRPI